MPRTLVLGAMLLSAAFGAPLLAADGDVAVYLPYKDPRNPALTNYREAIVRPAKGDRVQWPVNDQSLVERPLPPGSFVIDAPGDPRHLTLVTKAEYERLRALQQRFAPSVGASVGQGPFYTAHRTTGGFSAAELEGFVLHAYGERDPEGIRSIDLYVRFQDFKRDGDGSKGDPIRGPEGFETKTYIKALRVAEVSGRGENLRVRVETGDGTYAFEPMPLPKPREVTDPRRQRFVLDFGRNPYFETDAGEKAGAERQLLYRVYVARIEGSDAIIIRPDSLANLERARAGASVPVRYYRVPLALLRVAPAGADGDALLNEAGSNFVRDQGLVASDGGEMSRLFRANAFHGGEVELLAGTNLQDSLTDLDLSLESVRKAAAAEHARRLGLNPGDRCGDDLGGLGRRSPPPP